MTIATRVQVLIGITVLLLGTLVYVLDRPAEQTLLANALNLPSFTLGVFGAIGDVLPAFAHVFAFILFTVALLGNSRSDLIVTCVGWFLVDVAFELGQHPSIASWLSAHLSSGPENLILVNHTADYFVYGTFDPGDLIAISMGALTAYLVIEKTKRQESCYEACTRAGLFLYAPAPTSRRSSLSDKSDKRRSGH